MRTLIDIWRDVVRPSCCFFLLLIPFSVSAQPLSSIFTEGEIGGEFGPVVEYTNFHSSSVEDKGLAWGFGEVEITSGEWNGLQAGAAGMLPFRIWEEHSLDYREVFADDYVIRDLFLDFTIPHTKTKLTGGRRKFFKSPTTDGDSHQGFELQVNDFERIKISASVIGNWINNADAISMSARGITGWESVDDVAPYADDYYYSALITTDCIPERVEITPFFNWLNHVMGAVGAKWDLSQVIKQDLAIGFDGSYALLINDHPKSEKPDYENVDMMKFHLSLKQGGEAFVGVGYFAYGKGNLDTSVGIFAGDDPMDRDDFVGYDDRNDTHLWYLDFDYKKHALDINGMFGFGKNRPNDTNFIEGDFWLFYNITEHLKIGGYMVYTEYSTNIISDYFRLGSALTYSL